MTSGYAIITTMIFTALGLYLLSAIKVPCDVTETYQEQVYLPCEQTTQTSIVDTSSMWGLFHTRKAETLIRNPYSAEVQCKVNFIFNNTVQIETKTLEKKLISGETSAYSVDVPLSGDVIVDTKIIPEVRYETKTRVVHEQCSLSEYYLKGNSIISALI